MINRLLIRIKVLQILYNFYHNSGMTGTQAISTLKLALDKSYQLYIHLCGLPLQVSHVSRKRLEREISKIAPEEKVVEILRGLSDNALIDCIEADEDFMALYSTCAFNRDDMEEYLTKAVGAVVTKGEALDDEGRKDLDASRQYWKDFYRSHILNSEDYRQCLENISVYVNDDIDIVYTFVTKLFNGVTKEKSFSALIKPPYMGEAEEKFGPELLAKAMKHKDEYRDIISRYFKNWDRDRVSEMDFIILQLALTEAIAFPSIATRVTINEYLNLARYYSSPKSTTFINGILHGMMLDLKKQGVILGE
ncbi:transcription antitermination factor NusB [Porphyromonas sp.]|uniref:transcription antitermination protein NusB n=1 Tax=Porphyromonas sp. TaxID=1924944 RepID=UPI0026DBC36F|nr:transcription antitermination factor NusB [Porphyromonas sp.]MDO4770850.1 transcription antitermination factor NusB [Porphyromonas sp.]